MIVGDAEQQQKTDHFFACSYFSIIKFNGNGTKVKATMMLDEYHPNSSS